MRHEMSTQDEVELDRIAQYWTEERMAAAKPVEPPPLSPAVAAQLGLPEAPQDVGEPPTQVGQPYAPDPTAHPYDNCGAIFFTVPGEGDMRGSASFVGAAGVLLTAAHCVRSGVDGTWYTNVHFVRAYGAANQRFGVTYMHTWQSWVNPGTRGDHAYDYAFCRVANVDDWNGYLGLRTGALYTPLTDVGYPDNYGGGRQMYAVSSRAVRQGSYVYLQDDPFREGSSGGPCIANPSAAPGTGNNLANGVHSFHRDGDPGSYSPYFDDQTRRLFDQV